MNKFIITMTFLFMSIISLSAQLEGFNAMKDVESFKTQMSKEAVSTTSISSDFVQKKYLSFMEDEIESSGVFKFKKDNMLRWEYVLPYSYTIVLNGDKVSIKEKGKKVNEFDMSSNKTFKKINDLMLDCVRGTVLENDEFDLEYYESKDNYLIHLLPKAKELKNMLQNVYIYFDKSDYQVSSINMTEESGDYTKIIFKNKQLNEKLSEEHFMVK